MKIKGKKSKQSNLTLVFNITMELHSKILADQVLRFGSSWSHMILVACLIVFSWNPDFLTGFPIWAKRTDVHYGFEKYGQFL